MALFLLGDNYRSSNGTGVVQAACESENLAAEERLRQQAMEALDDPVYLDSLYENSK
jgi:hypothetical protein